jgi:hypothetical protein
MTPLQPPSLLFGAHAPQLTPASIYRASNPAALPRAAQGRGLDSRDQARWLSNPPADRRSGRSGFDPQWSRLERQHAIARRQIKAKLELLEQILHEGRAWFDRREFFLLASACMDLERLEPLAAANRFTKEGEDDKAS